MTTALVLFASTHAQEATVESTKSLTAKPASQPTSPIAVTSVATGQVMLLDRRTLNLLQTVDPKAQAPVPGPMLVAEDLVRRVFYIGNFDRGLGRIPVDGTKPKTLDLGGVMVGVAISPDGRLLAVNGARDLTLRLVDLDSWQVTSKTPYGKADDSPLHSHMTHGLASTHPIWLRDGSGILTEDNIHEEVVLIGRDGKLRARSRMRSGIHTFLTTKEDVVLALAEGTVDGTVPPCVAVLEVPTLKIIREIVIPLEPEEPAKLHHGMLSADEDVLVVANMGPMHGDGFGTTVAAVNWRSGQVLWRVPTVRSAGHVRFLDRERVIVLGHQDANLAIVDARTGRRRETWNLPGADSLGHSLAEEPGGTVLLIDTGAGRLVRVGAAGVAARSPHLGERISEASLSE